MAKVAKYSERQNICRKIIFFPVVSSVEFLDLIPGEAGGILGRKDRSIKAERPLYPYNTVVKPKDALRRRAIIIVDLILESGRIGKHGESVREATGNEQLSAIPGRKLDRDMTPECGRTAPEIDCHIHYAALTDAHQLGLRCIARLEMKTADHPAGGKRLVLLNEIHMSSDRTLELILSEYLAEVPAGIGIPHRVNNPHIGKRSGCIFHIGFLFKVQSTKLAKNFRIP